MLRQLRGHPSAWTIPTADNTSGFRKLFSKTRTLSVTNIRGVITTIKIDLLKFDENEIRIKILNVGSKDRPFLNGARLKFIHGKKSEQSKCKSSLV